VPDELRPVFAFKPGQHLTLRADIAGEDVRRNYSLCVSPSENQLKVTGQAHRGRRLFQLGARQSARRRPDRGDGAARQLHLGVRSRGSQLLCRLLGGSGITPILSLLKTALEAEPHSRFTLLYGNRDSQSVIFLEELARLKNRYMDRLQVHHFLAEEARISSCSTACSTATNATTSSPAWSIPRRWTPSSSAAPAR
jgi:ring-1,2-phenylacetyl-CoA epoxidase subunit PaaE